MDMEAVIGLEIHVQLNSPTKMFCDCPNRPGDRPNLNTCPICLWLPGTFPVLSRDVLERAAMTCMALRCEIQPVSAFDQKVYYYPDLPKGFQLSQFHKPLAKNGWVEVSDGKKSSRRIRIREIHLEEDVAKLIHEMEGKKQISLVDFNRAGAPLIEIVTEPDIRTPQEAMEFLRKLRSQIRYVGGAECSMERGTMRVDANISLRPKDTDEFNNKVEIKNMNSIRHVGDAITREIERQKNQLKAGKPIVLHTRLWDAAKGVTSFMRAKFSGPCVPDPSVAEIEISPKWLDEMRGRLPEMPDPKRDRFMEEYGLTLEEAALMSEDREVAEYFEALAKQIPSPRTAAHWMSEQVLPAIRERGQDPRDTCVTPSRVADLLRLIDSGEINAQSAKEVLPRLFDFDLSPGEIVEKAGLRQVTDQTELEDIVDRLVAESPGAVEDYRSGKKKAIGFLVGQAMRLSGGKADPKAVKDIIERKLSSL